MTSVKIEFCRTNMESGSQVVYQRLRATFPHLRVREFGCLGLCDACAASLYCLVNGSPVHGRTAEELWQNVLAAIGRQQGE